MNLDPLIQNMFSQLKRTTIRAPEPAVEAKPEKKRTARLNAKLAGIFDQAKGCSVRVIPTSGDFLVEVRPKGRRRTYDMLLSEVARIIITRTALAEKGKR